MSQKYRDKIDIIAQLLNAARSGATRTEMIYGVMITYGQLKEYLQMLTDNNLIRYDKAGQRFITTHKGYQFMETYEDLSKLIHPIATTTN
jgi:predicted transcriptional regulator